MGIKVKGMKRRNPVKSSSNDIGGIRCLYLHAPSYRKIALERLKSPLLSDSYRALLWGQIEECTKEMERKAL